MEFLAELSSLTPDQPAVLESNSATVTLYPWPPE